MDKTHHSVLLDECRLPYKDPLPFGNPLADILHHLRRTLPCLVALLLLPLRRREEEGKRYDDVGDFDPPNLDLREEVDHNHAVEGEEEVHRSLEGEGEDPVGSEGRCWEGEGRSLAAEEGEVHNCCRVVEGEEDHLCLLLHLLHKSRDRILTSLGRRS